MGSLSQIFRHPPTGQALIRGAAGLAVLLACPAYGAPGDTELVSVSPRTNEAAGASGWPSISADGRFVAFMSSSSTLGATFGRLEIFLRDRVTEQTTRVSVGLGGANPTASSSYTSISADGRYVAFGSGASNLVPNDTNDWEDVFVRDMQTGLTERVNVSSDETEAEADGYAVSPPSISADGRYVAFHSSASNLVPGDTNASADVFVRDRLLGITERVSVGYDGQPANCLSSYPSISADGLHVVFGSCATNLVPNDPGFANIFAVGRTTGLTELVNVSSSGVPGNSGSYAGAVSEDGRYVVFNSDATNLVPNDTNGKLDVFVRDRHTGHTERVSISSSGGQANRPSGEWVSISPDGRYVAFDSVASNLVPGDTNRMRDVFVRDRQAGTTQRVSVTSDGVQAAGISWETSLSADGRYVAFVSDASNLVTNDLNGSRDVFIHELDGAPSAAFAFTIKPGALAFGNQAMSTSTTLSVWLRNKGTTPLPIVSVELRGTDRAMFKLANWCPASVPVGMGCSIKVTFTPTSVGAKAAKLRVVAGEDTIRMQDLTGTGVEPGH